MPSVLGYMLLPTTKDPAVSAALGYVNAGTDRRITGEVGKRAGQIQSASAYKSTTPPVKGPVQQFGSVYIQVSYDPDRPQNVRYAIAVRKGNGRWATLRVGYVYDPNWGDERTIGYNPNPEIVGGYFLDIIPKLDSDRSFIDGVV
jgi:hypothetical protein